MSNAETPEGAVAKAQDAIHVWIENSKSLGRAIPRPSRHHIAMWAAIKTA
ncbi:type II toxin-antitoxin system HicB family antitoxin [Labrys neptuniae]